MEAGADSIVTRKANTMPVFKSVTFHTTCETKGG